MAKNRVKVFCPNCGEVVICLPRKTVPLCSMYKGVCETEGCKAEVAVGDYAEGEKCMKVMILLTGGWEV